MPMRLAQSRLSGYKQFGVRLPTIVVYFPYHRAVHNDGPYLFSGRSCHAPVLPNTHLAETKKACISCGAK